MSQIVMWHGSQRWQGPPEVRASRAFSAYHGPGIYMTTDPQTAYEHAKGGGSIIRFVVDSNLRLAEDVWINLPVAQAYVAERPRLRHKRELAADLERSARQRGERRPDYLTHGLGVPAEVLINLFVNYDLVKGAQGPALARFLVSHGADAGVVTRGTDDWLILMNPAKIVSWEKVPYGKTHEAERGLYRRLKKA